MLEKFKQLSKTYGWKVSLGLTVLSSAGGAYVTNRLLEKQLEPPEKVEGLPPPGAGTERQQGLATTARPAENPAGTASGAASSGDASTDAAPAEGGPSVAGGTAGADGATPAPGALPGATPSTGTEPPAAPGNEMPPLMEYEVILTRNLFDPNNPLRFSENQPVAETGPTEPVVPPLDARLYQTVEAEPTRYSWAILSRNDDTSPQETFKIGDDLYGQGMVKRIGRKKIVVQRPDGGEQTLEIWTGQPAPGTTKVAEGPKGDSSGLGDSIRKIGENKFEIDAKEIQAALDNMDKVTSSARIVPSYENGSPSGFKIFRIKPDSFYNKLGLRNGDVIKKINGFDINSTEKAMQMFTILRTEKSLSIELARRGQNMTMDYTIR